MKSSILRYVSVAAAALAMFAGAAPAAHAQSSVSAGYQVASLSQGGSRTTYPVGFCVTAAAKVAPMIAVVGEVGGSYHALHQLNVTATQYTYQGGLRFSAPMPMGTPFFQVLVGGARDGISGGTVEGSSQSAFSTQVGGGVDVNTPGPVKARFGVDYRRVFFSDANGGGENDIRFVVGLVFPVGH